MIVCGHERSLEAIRILQKEVEVKRIAQIERARVEKQNVLKQKEDEAAAKRAKQEEAERIKLTKAKEKADKAQSKLEANANKKEAARLKQEAKKKK